MPTVLELIHYLTPQGTNPALRKDKSIHLMPLWPPDLFAIVATLVDQSSCYTHSRYARLDFFNESLTLEITTQRDIYAPANPTFSESTQWILEVNDSVANGWWKELVTTYATAPVDAGANPTTGVVPGWWDAALKLLVLADEASIGVGFLGPFRDKYLPSFVAQETIRALERNTPSAGGPTFQFPFSLCLAVPSCKVCVQPKTHTAQAGCTIHNLTHHLCLLPARTRVETEWTMALAVCDAHASGSDALPSVIAKSSVSEPFQPFNILLVPFPYAIDDAAFCPDVKCSPNANDPAHFFSLNQTWLRDRESDRPVTADVFVNAFLLPLLRSVPAGPTFQSVDWLILPELALEGEMARKVARLLAKKAPTLKLFMSGVLSPGSRDAFPRNEVYTAVFATGPDGTRAVGFEGRQAKHHRWRIEQSQVDKYNLRAFSNARTDRKLDVADWWEQIDIERRTCRFWNFYDTASFCMLVCEDLARIDPVQTVLRAVGPNMLIALLMDDEQLEYRWSSRYSMASRTTQGRVACRSRRSVSSAGRKNSARRERLRTPSPHGGKPLASPANVKPTPFLPFGRKCRGARGPSSSSPAIKLN